MPVDPASSLARLLDAPIRPGVVEWIGLRPDRRAPMATVRAAVLDPADGLVGDRYRSSGARTRQLTLVQAEHLAAIAGHLGLERVEPEQLRRNVVVRGINLAALRGRQFRLGQAVLEATGSCDPCSRMEETFGPGGYNAVRGHGGITARVIEGGPFAIGDPIVRIDQDA